MEVETKNKALDEKILIIDEKINSQENLIKTRKTLLILRAQQLNLLIVKLII